MANPFTAHPASVGESYAEHCAFAFAFGARMAVGGVVAMVHAIFPFAFITTASRTLDELNARRDRGRRSAPRG
jgi:hypothetical protein